MRGNIVESITPKLSNAKLIGFSQQQCIVRSDLNYFTINGQRTEMPCLRCKNLNYEYITIRSDLNILVGSSLKTTIPCLTLTGLRKQWQMVSNDWNSNTLNNVMISNQHIVGLDQSSNFRPISCSIADYGRAGIYIYREVRELTKQ